MNVDSSNLSSLFSFSCFYSWWVLLPFIHKWQWRVNFYKVFQNMRRAQSMSHLRSSEWTDKWKGSTGLDWTSRAKPTVDGNSFPLSRACTINIGFAKTTPSGIQVLEYAPEKSIEYLNLLKCTHLNCIIFARSWGRNILYQICISKAPEKYVRHEAH